MGCFNVWNDQLEFHRPQSIEPCFLNLNVSVHFIALELYLLF